MKKKMLPALFAGALVLGITLIACVLENDPTQGGISGTAQSRDGPLTVNLTFNASKAIETVMISAASSDYYYSKSGFKDAADKIKADGKIDIVSGATVTSKAINEAVAQALAQAAAEGKYGGSVEEEPGEEEPVVAVHTPWRSSNDGSIFTGTRTGTGTITATGNEDVASSGIDEGGVVTVVLTFTKGKITDVIYSETTPGSGGYESAPTTDKERIIAANSPEFDTKTGATFTSRAVSEAAWAAINVSTYLF